jgi:hypothetical protein
MAFPLIPQIIATGTGLFSNLRQKKQETGMNLFQRIKARKETTKAGGGGSSAAMPSPLAGILGQASGNVQFGAARTQGFIPIVIAVAVAITVAIGGFVFSGGKRKKRR